MRKLNIIFLAGVLGVLAAAGGSMYLLHGYQVRRRAGAMLDVARRAEESGDLAKAAAYLNRYIGLNHEDGPAYAWHARVVDKKTAPAARGERLLGVFEEAVRRNPDDRELERRCAEIAMDPRIFRHEDAIRHLERLHGPIKTDAEHRVEAAALEDLLGQCHETLKKFDQAFEFYTESIKHDPSRVATYDRLARLRREAMKRPDLADETIERMRTANPESAQALVLRYRYRKEFGPSADEKDVSRALELGPDDAEVLIAAAELAREKKDLPGARKYIDRGLEKHPSNIVFYQLAAGMDLAEAHPERAAEMLRRGLAAVPDDPGLAMQLTEVLIDQAAAGDETKLRGKDGAEQWIERLKKIGVADGYLAFLDGRAAMASQSWERARESLESARSLLPSDGPFSSRVNLLLADCYDHLGQAESRLAAIQRAAGAAGGAATAQVLYARELERQGKLDEAMALHLKLAETRPESRLDVVRVLIAKTNRLPAGRRDWEAVERRLQEVEKAAPGDQEAVALLKVDMLAARGRLDEAEELLASLQTKAPGSLKVRLAAARLALAAGNGSKALQILDQAEKDLGTRLDIQLARLDVWTERGGDEARAAVAKAAESLPKLAADDRAGLLDRLTQAAVRLRDFAAARRYAEQLAALRPGNFSALLAVFDVCLQSDDLAGARAQIERIRKAEGDREGTHWRFAQAALDLEEHRRNPATGPDALQAAATQAARIVELRPNWWGGPVLKGQIAELKNLPDEAAEQFKKAVMLGNQQPSVVRRLVAMIYRGSGDRGSQIEDLLSFLRSKGVSPGDAAISSALTAISRGETAKGLERARLALPDSSTSDYDHLLLARLYTVAGKYADAEREHRRAVELGPGVPENWLGYVQFLAGVNRPASVVKEVVEAAGRALPPDQAPLTLARCWTILGDPKRAEEAISQARARRPDDPAALQGLVLLHMNQNRIAQALQVLDQFERLPELSAEGKLWASRVRPGLLMGTGRRSDRDQAARLIDENLKRNGDNVVDLRMKISALASRPAGRGEAVKLLENIVASSDPPGLDDQFYLAKLYLAETQVDKYQRIMEKLVGPGRVNRSDQLAYHIRFLFDRDRWDEAGPYVALLKQADPGGLTGLDLETQLLSRKDQRQELLASLREHGRAYPDQIGQVGDLLSRYGFKDEAEQAYRAYVDRDPGRPDRVLALARFYATTGRPADAMGILKPAWEALPHELVAQAALPVYDSSAAAPDDKRQVKSWVETVIKAQPDSWLRVPLSDMRLKDGNPREAAAQLRSVLAGNPDDLGALNNLAWILAMTDPPAIPEALDLIGHAIEVAGGDPTLSDTRAVILIRANRLDEAVTQIKSALELPTEGTSVHRSLAAHLAWAYQAKGQLAEARAAFHQAEARGYTVQGTDLLERPHMEGVAQLLKRDPADSPSPTGNSSESKQ